MTKNIIEDEEFKDIQKKHIQETLSYLINKDLEFDIVVNIQALSFTPELPKELKDSLNKFSLFSLAGYTYSTIELDLDSLSFEAGFGKENFGSLVKVPLHSIFQVIFKENTLAINLSATVDKFNKDQKTNSLNIFKNNPKNKKFN